MRPNIIFFLIDGLRADQCFGKDKTSFTPNIDSLRKKGTYFTNAFTSVDGTLLSLSTIFHSLYPIETPISRNKLTLQKNNLFDILVKNGYELTTSAKQPNWLRRALYNIHQTIVGEYQIQYQLKKHAIKQFLAKRRAKNA